MQKTPSLLPKKPPIPLESHFWRYQAGLIFENIATPFIAVDLRGFVTIFNAAAELVFARRSNEVRGKLLRAVFPGIDEDEYYLLQALKTGIELKDTEFTYCPYLKTEGVFLHSVGLIKGPHRRVVGAIWMRKDMTQERKFQKEMSNATIQATVSQIAAGTAHEIRNPLTTAKGYLQLAMQKCAKNSTTRGYLQLAEEEIDQASQTISNFLALVHPGAAVLQFASFNSLVNELLQLTEKVTDAMNIEVVAQLNEQLPLCLLDAKMVQQAVLHVLNNAIQAMPQGGQLTVLTDYLFASDEISLTISDTGMGIASKDLNRIFTPFYSTKVEGAGLGLTLTNRIVQHHQGRVTVTSQEGQGTTMELVFPVKPL